MAGQVDTEEKSIVKILGLFPNGDVQNVIVEVASSQEEKTAAPAVDALTHSHGCLCSCCSDSRETVQMDAGAVTFVRIPGGFGTEPDGEPSDDFGYALERAILEKEPVVVRQHSRCGAMAIIYAYHSRPDGEAYVRSHYGKFFTEMAKRRANLYGEVLKRVLKKDENGQESLDFSFYAEKYGLPLYGEDCPNYDDAARFQTCMALQQGAWDHAAATREIEALNGDIPALFSFNHVAQGGRKYIQKLGSDKFIALPSPKEEDFETKMRSVLALYPKTLHERINSEAFSQQEWSVQNEDHLAATGKSMAQVQAPPEAIIRCSGLGGDESYNFAKAPGEALFLRLPGGFMTHADGSIKFAAAQFAELARAYKVPVLRIEQLSDTEGLEAIYKYNKDLAGAEEIEKMGRPRLVRLAKRRASLYTEVRKRIEKDGFAYYEKMGIPLNGTDDEKFVACMAIEQGLGNYEALKALRKAEPSLPQPVLFHKVIGGGTYVYEDGKGFHKLPKLDAGGDIVARPDADRLFKKNGSARNELTCG